MKKKLTSLFKKDNFSKEKILKLKWELLSQFSKEKLEKRIYKAKSLKKEDILLWYYEHRNSILLFIFWVFFIISSIIFVFLIKKTYSIYNKLKSNITTIELIADNKILEYVKTNNLRTVTSIVDSLYVKEYSDYNENKYTKLYKNFLKELLVNIYYWDSVTKAAVDSFLWTNSILWKREKIQKIFKIIDSYKIDQLKQFDTFLPIRKYISKIHSFNKKNVLKYIKDKKLVNDTANIIEKMHIYELPSITKFIDSQANLYKQKYLSNVAPYENFLSHILLSSVNIWINPFSEAINPNIFWSEYLKKANYIDLNLIKYWSDFFTLSYIGKLYQGLDNIINWFKLQKINIIPDKNLAKIGLNIKFSLTDEKSFYGLISKLTLTSDVKNIMLINEFTYDLWQNIKKKLLYSLKLKNNNLKYKKWLIYIFYIVNKCSNSYIDNNCNELFGWSNELIKSILAKFNISYLEKSLLSKQKSANKFGIRPTREDLIESYMNKKDKELAEILWEWYINSTFHRYIVNEYYKIDDLDKLIWARLYDCIKDNWYCWDIFDKDFSQIKDTIKDFAWCNKKEPIDFNCKYNFINKFNTNYFIAYTMVDKLWEIDYSLLERLKDVYNNLSSILQLDKFSFVKNEGKNTIALYTADVTLSIFYKYLTQDDYSKILSYIWKRFCEEVTNWNNFNLWKALSYVKNKYNILSKWNIDSAELYDLRQLQNIINDLQKENNNSILLDKLLANLQVYRIFKERWYCK